MTYTVSSGTLNLTQLNSSITFKVNLPIELDRLPSMVMPLPAVTWTSDLLIPTSNQHIYEPKYICDQNWAKFP